MNTNTVTTHHLATRQNALEYSFFGMLLPNPDPILKRLGNRIETYRDLRVDSHIGSCIRRRKGAVQALDFGIDKGQAQARVAKAVQTMLDGLPVAEIIASMQECTLYGYAPHEIIWVNQPGGIYPSQVIAKPPEWFCFDPENNLRFKTRAKPYEGEVVPERKFLLPRQDATYQNPYGFADLSMCYWPLLFKKNGLKFWLSFTEKFGSAFSIGKLPRSATKEEHDALLHSMETMLQNAVATIPDEGSVELIEMAGKSASAELYEKLVMYCRSEIAIALLGQNQTTEATANKASATAGLAVTDDLRDADAAIICQAMNQLIDWFCTVNFGDVVRPRFNMWDQDAQDSKQAARDKSNYDAGARFTTSYFMRAYQYAETDLQPMLPAAAQPAPIALQAGAASFSETTAPKDPVADLTTQATQATEPVFQGLADQIQEIVAKASSPADLQRSIATAYGNLDSAELVKIMSAAMALAQLQGIDQARSNTTNTVKSGSAALAALKERRSGTAI